MKARFLSLSVLAAAAMALFSCQKNDSETVTPGISEGTPFELILSAPASRTENDGLATKWSAEDSVCVFHTQAGFEDYGANDRFEISADDLESGRFYGAISDELQPETSYDWYVLYPYNSRIETPAFSDNYFRLGSYSKNTAQSQDGNDNMSHLAGKYFPLYGVAKGVESEAVPGIAMKQLLSVVKVVVTNANEAPLTVKNISFTAPENISGSYFIDITGDAPAFEPSGEDYVSNVASLTVKKGEELANGASAAFYIAVVPFVAQAGSTLTLNVNGYEKSVGLSAASEFAAGSIKTLNFSYDYVNDITEPVGVTGWYRVEDLSWLSDGDQIAIVASDFDYALSTEQRVSNRGAADVTKSTDGVYSTLAAGDDVQVLSLIQGDEDGTYYLCCANGSTVGEYLYAASSSANQLKSTPEPDENACFKFTIEANGVAAIVAQGANTRNTVLFNSNNNPVLFSCYASGQKPVSVYKLYGYTVSVPHISVVSANPIDASNAGGEYSIDYYLSNDDGASVISAVADVDWIGPIDCSNYGVIAFSVDAQTTGAAARSGVITISYPGAADVSVTVNQEAGPEPGPIAGGTSITVTMHEYVESHQCTVSSGNDVFVYKVLDLSPAVRMMSTGTSNNCGSFWADGEETKQWRLYQAGPDNVIVKVAEGCELKTVKFTYKSEKSGVLRDGNGDAVTSGTAVEVSGTYVEFTVGNSKEDGTGGQVRITAVEVVYTGDGVLEPEPEQPSDTRTIITMEGSRTIMIGDSFNLNATCNVPEATITFSSEDESIASVSSDGTITGIAVGKVKIWAEVAAVEGHHTDAVRSCEVTVKDETSIGENEEEIDFALLGYANQQEVSEVSGTNFTVTFDKGTNTITPKYYNTGTAIRVYGGGYFTVSSAATFTKIELTFGTGDKSNELSASSGELDGGVWTGSGTSVTFSVGGTSGHRRIKAVKVTF